MSRRRTMVGLSAAMDGKKALRNTTAEEPAPSVGNKICHLSRSSPPSRVTNNILEKHKVEGSFHVVGYAAQSEECSMKRESGGQKHPPLPSHRGRLSAQLVIKKIPR